MDKKNIGLDFEMHFQEIKELNPSFDLAKVAVAYHGLNRNRSYISKEVFEKARDSMYNIPIVGRYIPEDDDFGSHDIMVAEVNGEQTLEAATVPFGVVPESSEIGWEMIEEDDGTQREYMIADCVIWKRSFGYQKLVSQSKWSQSMEITVNDWEYDTDDNMIIKDMTFNALCILGNSVEPCFESANIQFSITPETEEFKKNFSAMLGELKEMTIQFSNNDPDATMEEGGQDGLEMENKELNGEVNDISTSTETVEANEGLEPNVTEPEESYSEEETGTEPESPAEEFVSYSRTYNELWDILSRGVRSLGGYVTESDGRGADVIVAETCYYLCDFDDDYVFVDIYTYTEKDYKETYARMTYTKSEDGVTFGVPEEMVLKWLTLTESEKLDAERDELSSLREFKASTLASEHKHAVDDMIASEFADVLETEEYEALGDAIYTLEAEDLTEKLFAIRGRHAVAEAKKTKEADDKSATKIPVETKKYSKSNERYGSLFATYAIKK